jgi:hypothetical protein
VPLIFHNGQLLFHNGELAFSEACCCNGACGCDDEPEGDLKAIFRANTPDCALFDGLEIPLIKTGPGTWHSGVIPELASTQGWDDMEIEVFCSRPNDCNPSDPEKGCKDYIFFGGFCSIFVEDCKRVVSCTCSPFQLITEELEVTGGSGQCCEICTCGLFADNKFHWEVVEA